VIVLNNGAIAFEQRIPAERPRDAALAEFGGLRRDLLHELRVDRRADPLGQRPRAGALASRPATTDRKEPR